MVSRLTAEAVIRKRPWPRSTQSGTSSRAARTWASTLTSSPRAQSASLVSSPRQRSTPALPHQTSLWPSTSGLFDQCGHALVRRGVAGDCGSPNLPRHCLGGGLVEVVDHHPEAVGREPARDRVADAATGAGNDDAVHESPFSTLAMP